MEVMSIVSRGFKKRGLTDFLCSYFFGLVTLTRRVNRNHGDTLLLVR